jgi:predicted TPR repeat methyltransferase
MDELSDNTTLPEEASIPEAMFLAVGWHRDGNVRPAAEVYRRILAHDPKHVDALHFLGVALHQLGRSADGAKLLRRALQLMPGHVAACNNLGNILKETGNPAGAEQAFRRVLELQPDNTDTLNNLGVVLKERGLLEDAVSIFERALTIDPNHSDLWHNLGNTLKKLGRIDEALSAYRKAITLKPYHTEAYRNLGRMLYIAGRSGEAAEVYHQWLSQDPDNPIARHLLAACSRKDVPQRASDAYVSSTFDNFATSFDDVMTRLNYHAPALALDAVRRSIGEPSGVLAVLDAGCGTGLCGSLLRPYAAHLTGVDLSRGMLDQAGGRSVYDDLVQAELTTYLTAKLQRFDLIVSVDTLCYFGALGPVAAAAAAALRPGGWFVFTLEAREDDTVDGYTLQPHGRYNHAAGYVHRVLDDAGFQTVSIGNDFLRSEGGQAVEGLVVAANRAVKA